MLKVMAAQVGNIMLVQVKSTITNNGFDSNKVIRVLETLFQRPVYLVSTDGRRNTFRGERQSIIQQLINIDLRRLNWKTYSMT
ncbi:hypothetical protein GCM10023310_69310 [Paenibacillus vulneris]